MPAVEVDGAGVAAHQVRGGPKQMLAVGGMLIDAEGYHRLALQGLAGSQLVLHQTLDAGPEKALREAGSPDALAPFPTTGRGVLQPVEYGGKPRAAVPTPQGQEKEP